MRTLIAKTTALLWLWLFKPSLALLAARFAYAFVRGVFKFDPGPWLASTLLGATSRGWIEIGRWSALGVPALLLLALYEAQRAPTLRVAMRFATFDFPDSSIRYAFQFVHPAPFRSFQEKERVGKQLIDKFSSGALRAWGREMVGIERTPLVEIPKEAWRGSRFTYWFLDEGQANRDICHVECDTPQSGGVPWLFTDLQVNRGQLEMVWPDPAST